MKVHQGVVEDNELLEVTLNENVKIKSKDCLPALNVKYVCGTPLSGGHPSSILNLLFIKIKSENCVLVNFQRFYHSFPPHSRYYISCLGHIIPLNFHIFTQNVSLGLPSHPRTHCICFVHNHVIMSTFSHLVPLFFLIITIIRGFII